MEKDNRPFYCYLDDFDQLTIIVPINNYNENNSFSLIGNDEIIDLTINEKFTLDKEIKLIANFNAYIDLSKIYYVKDQDGNDSELYTGKIVRTELFDNIYQYKKDDLGFTYTKDSTSFKIWTPVAKYVKIELVSPNTKTLVYNLTYKNSGIWQANIEGDLEGFKYRYFVYVNGVERIVSDPYAIASNANAEYAYVVDKSQFYQMKYESNFSGNILEAIIYEMSVRDFTNDPEVPFNNRSKFLGIIEENVKTKSGLAAGIDYLKELGITHVQFMPIFDFYGTDEINCKQYNWGYNPQQYFVPEGSYSTNPNDPYARINEMKKMIDELHKNDISVVMDVVYNHVFNAEDFSMEKLVPGYTYHVDRQGICTNISGCFNDVATYRKMIRKLIIDNIKFWVSEYKIDGFRFDLMGMIDYETMNELRQDLHDFSEHIIVYGEGWNMYSSNMTDRMAHLGNKKVLHTIGFFNDKFRDSVKGSTFELLEKGYATGDPNNTELIKEMLMGSAHNRFMFQYTTQSINYVECHDNLTFFDKAISIDDNEELVKKQELLATSMVLLSQGVPFLHSGQEFFRSKQMVGNTYASSDEINRINWNQKDQNIEFVEYIKKLIAIRKKFPCFKLKSTSDLDIEVEIFEMNSKSLMIHYNSKCDILIVFKPLGAEEMVIVPDEYKILLSSSENYEVEDNYEYILKDIGTYIFVKE